MKRILFLLTLACLLTSCDVFLPDEGHLGQPCTPGGMCIDGSECFDGRCIDPDTADGDSQMDGDRNDGDTLPDGDSQMDGDISDEDTLPDGDTPPDGDDDDDDNLEDGDNDPIDEEIDETVDIDTDIDESGLSPDSCYGACGGNPGNCWCNDACYTYGNCCADICTYCPGATLDHATSSCDSGDVYWYDSCGTRNSKKEECGECGCSGNSCSNNNQYSSACFGNDVYWYDCQGVRQSIKQDCSSFGCSNGTCASSSLFSCSSGVCTDAGTGFEWQQDPTGGTMNWENAHTHCSNLTLNGSGWRLPNISELRTLVRNCEDIELGGACPVLEECSALGVTSDDTCLGNFCGYDYCKPEACSNDGGASGCYWPEEMNGTCAEYWVSSIHADSDLYGWYIEFFRGEVAQKGKTAEHNVRCVRSESLCIADCVLL